MYECIYKCIYESIASRGEQEVASCILKRMEDVTTQKHLIACDVI